MSKQIQCTSCGNKVRVTTTECPECGNRVELVNRPITWIVIGTLLLPLTVGGTAGAINHGTFDAELLVFLGIAVVGPAMIVAGYQKRGSS